MDTQIKKTCIIFVTLLCFITQSVAPTSEEMKKLKEVMDKSAREQGIDIDNLRPGETVMMPPEMTDEEEGSRHMPTNHRCDGCIAVAYQFEKGFAAAEKKVRKGARLTDADVLDVADDVCDNYLKDYGLKNVNGLKYLSGEGLKSDKQPGIMEGGGKWESRLKTVCRELIELYEEESIYDKYIDRGDYKLDIYLCTSYCSKDQIFEMKQKRDEL